MEGEVNGLVTYDRRFLRPQLEKWQDDIQSVYKAAASRGGHKVEEKGKRDGRSLLDL